LVAQETPGSSVLDRLAGPSESEATRLADWLAAIVQQRNFGLQPPPGCPVASAIAPLLVALSADFAQYRDVVLGAREAADRNAQALAAVVRTTIEHGELLRSTATTANQAGAGAQLVATAADALRSFAAAAAESAHEADGGLAEIGGALGELECRLDDGTAPLAQMRRSTLGITEFLLTLARLSRHAQLLSVNAAIEAAHLADAGSRFAIVAQEVRKLATSTRDSRADVSRINNELRGSTEQVAAAAEESRRATQTAAAEVGDAAEALSRTGHAIAEFGEMVTQIAAGTATQRSALEAVSSSIDQIAHHADEAARASHDAGKLDLAKLLAQAETGARRWQLLSANGTSAPTNDRLGRWIAALIAGTDPTAPADVDDDPSERRIAQAIRTLIERANADARDVLANVIEVAVAVSRNSFAWRSIGLALERLSREIEVVRVTESTEGARRSATLASEMEQLIESIRARYDGALGSLEGALARIAQITGGVQGMNGFVASMSASADRAGEILSMIETLSSETVLLSLNAAIEAAHAGEAGLGFSVIAEEIRELARSTNTATTSVSELVANVTTISADMQSAIEAAAGRTTDVSSSADRVRSAIGALRGAFESSMQHSLEVSAAATEQTRALDRVLTSVNTTASAVSSNAALATDKGRLELAMLGSRAHAIAARRPIGTVIERVRAFGEPLCVRLEAAFESALSSGKTSVQRLFDLRYTPIAGAEIVALRRLFDVSRVPVEGFNPPKYATPWDAAVDEALNDILESVYDAAAEFKPVVFFISDLNGLFYAYPRRKIAAWTNDFATDNATNRIKRMFEDEYALRVGRWGLGYAADDLGPRASYEAFRSAGCVLERGAERAWGGFVYARDTSMVCNEVVFALYVRGMRHSTLRICYDPSLI
jgi:methyl-accepting chemotaxis protein